MWATLAQAIDSRKAAAPNTIHSGVSTFPVTFSFSGVTLAPLLAPGYFSSMRAAMALISACA